MTIATSPTRIGTTPDSPLRIRRPQALEVLAEVVGDHLRRGGQRDLVGVATSRSRRSRRRRRSAGSWVGVGVSIGGAHRSVPPLAPRPAAWYGRVGVAGGHVLDDVLAIEAAGLALDDQPAEIQDGDPVGDLEHVVEVVGDHHHGRRRAPTSVLISSSTIAVCATPSAAVGSSMITSLRLRHHRLGDRDRLALPAGQRRDRLADRPDGRDVQLLQRLTRAPSPSSPRRAGRGSSGSCPRNMFWTMSRLSHSARSW